ncbi:hypothetical protein NL676_036562 [Syzygium grande]|nr:hypothetical protein NL676_036562 [Syzygium grande]
MYAVAHLKTPSSRLPSGKASPLAITVHPVRESVELASLRAAHLAALCRPGTPSSPILCLGHRSDPKPSPARRYRRPLASQQESNRNHRGSPSSSPRRCSALARL